MAFEGFVTLKVFMVNSVWVFSGSFSGSGIDLQTSTNSMNLIVSLSM